MVVILTHVFVQCAKIKMFFCWRNKYIVFYLHDRWRYIFFFLEIYYAYRIEPQDLSFLGVDGIQK